MSGTVHAQNRLPNGAPAVGDIVITVNTEDQVIRDPAGNLVFQGPLVVKLVSGDATFTLPASNDATLSPTGFTYTVTEQLKHVTKANYRTVDFQVTSGGTHYLADFASSEEVALDPSYGASLNGALGEIAAIRDLSDEGFADALSASIGAIGKTQFTRQSRPDVNLAFKKGDYNRAPTTQGAYNVIGIDTVNDKPYCRDDGNGLLRMVLTVDSLGRPLTWSNDKGFPAGTSWYNCVKILTFGGKLYMLTIQDSSGLPAIYRADPQAGNTALTWSSPCVIGKAGSTPRPACFNASATYMYFADYGDPTGGPDVRRSTDGTVWGTTTTFNTVRHVHCIAADPYNAGEVWVAMGDGVAGPNRRSLDNGATWHTATDAAVQLTELSFTSTEVWGVDDTAYVTAAIINKTTEEWAGISNGFHGNIAVPAFSNTGYWDPPSMAAGASVSTTVTCAGVIVGVPVVASYRGTLPDGVVISATALDGQVKVNLFNGSGSTVDLAAQNITVSTAGLTFAPAVFFGVVDPATEIFYMTTEQSVYYPYGGLFAILQKGGAPVLLDFGSIGNTPVFIWNGRLFYGSYNRPLLGLRS